MKKENDEKVIYLNKMFVGGFIDENTGNIGHEIINCFKADDGKQYLYITPTGGISSELNNKISYIIFVEKTGEGKNKVKIKYIAKVNKENQVFKLGSGLYSKKCNLYNCSKKQKLETYFNELEENNEDKQKFEIHQKQKDLKYGGIPIYEIFKNNYLNDIAIYYSFCIDDNDKNAGLFKPNKDFYILFNTKKTEFINPTTTKNFNDNKVIITIEKGIEKSFTRQKLKFSNFDNKKQYDVIEKALKYIIENESTANSNSLYKNDSNNKQNKKYNYLNFIMKENEEQIFTNLLFRYLNYSNVFALFEKYLNKRFENKAFDEIDSDYRVHREVDLSTAKKILNLTTKKKQWKKGRIDLLSIGNKNIVVIENKIKSGLNGTFKENNKNYDQLDIYYNYIETIKNKKKSYFIFVPNYQEKMIEEEICKKDKKIIKNYKIITYSQIYDFFNSEEISKKFSNSEKDIESTYYNEFMQNLYKHTLDTEQRLTEEFTNAININI